MCCQSCQRVQFGDMCRSDVYTPFKHVIQFVAWFWRLPLADRLKFAATENWSNKCVLGCGNKSCSYGRPCTSPFGFGQICKKFPRHMQKACQQKNQRSTKLTMRITQGNPSMLNSVEHEGSVKVFVSVSHAFCASSNLPILIIFQ